jgi:RHS repeat-associated protein
LISELRSSDDDVIDGVGGYMPLAVVTRNAGGTLVVNWVHGNHLGTPVVTTDAAGNAATTPNDYQLPGFPGQSRVLADLYYNRYRDYDPTTGRYLQADPIGLDGGQNDYVYVGNNPLRWSDPDGLTAIPAPLFFPLGELGAGPGLAALGAFCLEPIGWVVCGGTALYGGYVLYKWYTCPDQAPLLEMAGHRKNRTPSNRPKHEEGDARRGQDQGGEKADWANRGNRRPPRKPPSGHKGPWPPKT